MVVVSSAWVMLVEWRRVGAAWLWTAGVLRVGGMVMVVPRRPNLQIIDYDYEHFDQNAPVPAPVPATPPQQAPGAEQPVSVDISPVAVLMPACWAPHARRAPSKTATCSLPITSGGHRPSMRVAAAARRSWQLWL